MKTPATVGALLWASAAWATGGDPLPFTEESRARGISYFNLYGNTTFSFGTGATFADLDGDGDPDLVCLGDTSGIGLFENDGSGSFTNRGPGSGIAQTSRVSGVSAADFDGDGDQDLYVTNSLLPNQLFRNEGGFVFTSVGASVGVADAGAGMGSAWGDYDGDGWLDLYVCNRTGTNMDPTPNRLYRNRGDGTFEEVALEVGVDEGIEPNFQALFIDLGRDGDADLYVSTDKGGTLFNNHLYENIGGGHYVEVTDPNSNAANFDSMGTDFGDYSGNGLRDLYCANTAAKGNGLYVQTTPGEWRDETLLAGVGVFGLGWGVVFFDYDGDGWNDLYVCNEDTQPNALLRHEGTWPANDVAPALGVASARKSFGSAVADIDLDGDLDLFVSNYLGFAELFVNHEGERREWIQLRVAGRGANLHAIGAVVEVLTGGRWRVDEVMAGSSYKSQSELLLTFGLGPETGAEEIRVLWPGGTRRTLRNYAAGQRWTLYPPELLGDGDLDGDVDAADVAILLDCWTGPVPGALVPGCELMDLDGDGDVDEADLMCLLTRLPPSEATGEKGPDAGTRTGTTASPGNHQP